jgi:nitrite reductase/ring-hydroxylating ferredoxin subunit
VADIPFRKVCRVEDIPSGEGITVELDGSEIALFRDGSAVWCTEGRCPHAFELMSKAVLENSTVECLAHHYCFDLESGKAIKPTPGIAFLKIYPVRIEDGDVLVQFEADEDEW